MKPARVSGDVSEEIIVAAVEAAGIEVTDLQVRLLAAHANMVLTANRAINLTSITDPSLFVRLHIVDSLIPVRFVQLDRGTLLDIGSGAGFPGIPLAILGCHVLLCEATKKKAALLGSWVNDLALDAEVIPKRAEEAATSGVRADLVIARAVAPLASLVELASPLLPIGGQLVAMKGAPPDKELVECDRTAPAVGMRLAAVHKYLLQPEGDQRTLLVYEKTEEPHVQLPRRSGLAQKRPLRT